MRSRHFGVIYAVAIGECLAVSGAALAGAPCVPQWTQGFGLGSTSTVFALTLFDDGSGPKLFAGGALSGFVAWHNGMPSAGGTGWTALPNGPNAEVRVLTVFADGIGARPSLYLGGEFSHVGGMAASGVARWDGRAWSALGAGVNGMVLSLCEFDDGGPGGSALYVGGFFTTAGGAPASRIAKWDGSRWSALGAGVNGFVSAMTVFDDGRGGGPALYVGGAFTSAGGQPANHIARWDGKSWNALGAGTDDQVRALKVFDDGTGAGPALFVGGFFSSAGGVAANRIARWTPSGGWAALGSGMDSLVHRLVVFNDGSAGQPGEAGERLVALGDFISAGGLAAPGIARWNGGTWAPIIGGPPTGLMSGAVVTSDEGDALYVGGGFHSVGGMPTFSVARLQGCPAIAATPGDLTGDGHVDGIDLAVLLGQWSGTTAYKPCPPFRPADLNQDCRVDGLDLASLLAAWQR